MTTKTQPLVKTNQDIVLGAIMKRYGGLTDCFTAFREDVDAVTINLEDDLNGELDMYQIEDAINILINY